MQHAEWLTIAAVMQTQLWPHAPLEPALVEAYFHHLADLDPDDVNRAVRHLATEQRFPPTAPDIRALIEGPPRAWEEALAELVAVASPARAGDVPPPTLTDGALQRVVADRGWPAIRNASPHDPTWRAQFRDAYQSAQRTIDARRRQQHAGIAAAPQPAELAPQWPPVAALGLGTTEPEPEPAPDWTTAGTFRDIAVHLGGDRTRVDPALLDDDHPRNPEPVEVRGARRTRAQAKVEQMRDQWGQRDCERLNSREYRQWQERVLSRQADPITDAFYAEQKRLLAERAARATTDQDTPPPAPEPEGVQP